MVDPIETTRTITCTTSSTSDRPCTTGSTSGSPSDLFLFQKPTVTQREVFDVESADEGETVQFRVDDKETKAYDWKSHNAIDDSILSSISSYLKSTPYAPVEKDLPGLRKGRNDVIKGINITDFPDWINTNLRAGLESGSTFVKSGSRKISSNDDTIAKKSKAVNRAISLFARIAIHAKVRPNNNHYYSTKLANVNNNSNNPNDDPSIYYLPDASWMDDLDPTEGITLFDVNDLKKQFGLISALTHPNILRAASIYFRSINYKPPTIRQFFDRLKIFIDSAIESLPQLYEIEGRLDEPDLRKVIGRIHEGRKFLQKFYRPLRNHESKHNHVISDIAQLKRSNKFISHKNWVKASNLLKKQITLGLKLINQKLGKKTKKKNRFLGFIQNDPTLRSLQMYLVVYALMCSKAQRPQLLRNVSL